MSRESAGAAIRALRESRDWSLADFAAATGVSIMGLSYLERGVRKPHKSTVQKVEDGLGLPPGTYSRLLGSDGADGELAQLLETQQSPKLPERRDAVVVTRHTDTDVLEAHAEAHLDAIRSVIERLPSQEANGYETYIVSVINQCVKAEMLAASSWRVAVNNDAESAPRLMQYLCDLEATRVDLLARMPASLGARFEKACVASGLPDVVISTLVGLPQDELWAIRNTGAVPPGALSRIRAFVEDVARRADQ